MTKRDPDRPSTDSRNRLVVGMIFASDPEDRNAVSGMPAVMFDALTKQGNTVVTLPAIASVVDASDAAQRLKPLLVRAIPGSLHPAARRLRTRASDLLDQMRPSRKAARASQIQRTLDDELARLCERTNVDVLFGVCISEVLASFETDIPVVYYSDMTARIGNVEYPNMAQQSRARKEERDRMEGVAIARSAHAAFPSAQARDSAINDYGMSPRRAHIVLMGANATAATAGDDLPERAMPGRSGLEMCIVASDPIRKRLDLTIDVTNRLRSMGYEATLTMVGDPTQRAIDEPHVRCVGRLSQASAEDRRTYARTLAASHLMLLPSVAEAFGVSVCDAAHFGVPGVVSDVGGLPTAVQHDRTGLVMLDGASADDYAEAIDALVSDPDRYRRMCDAARSRALGELNWPSWAKQITELLQRAADERGAHVAGSSSVIASGTLSSGSTSSGS